MENRTKMAQLERFVFARIHEVFPETFSYEFENGSEELTRTYDEMKMQKTSKNKQDTTMLQFNAQYSHNSAY